MCVCECRKRLLPETIRQVYCLDDPCCNHNTLANIEKNYCQKHCQVFTLYFILCCAELNALLFFLALCRIWRRCTLCVIHQTCNCTKMTAHQPMQNDTICLNNNLPWPVIPLNTSPAAVWCGYNGHIMDLPLWQNR